MEEPESSDTEPRYEGEEDHGGEEGGEEEQEDGAGGDLHVCRRPGGHSAPGVAGGEAGEGEAEGEEGGDDSHHNQPEGEGRLARAGILVEQTYCDAGQAEEEPDQPRHHPDPPTSQA